MNFTIGFARFTVAFAAVILVSGCASQVSVKEVGPNNIGYLNENFSLTSLPQGVGQKIASVNSADFPFKQIKYAMDVTYAHADGRKENRKLKKTLLPAGNGLVKQFAEYIRNDIPYSMQYEVGYRNILPLRWQSFALNRAVSNPMIEVKQITLLPADVERAASGSEYVFETLVAPSIQVVNFTKFRLDCRAGESYPASRVYAGLNGNAVELSCELVRDGVVVNKSQYAYLLHYGIALQVQFQSSTMTRNYKVSDFEIH